MNSIVGFLMIISILLVALVIYVFGSGWRIIRHITTPPSLVPSIPPDVDKPMLETHKGNALVLSCMDYRFISETIEYLYGRNNQNDFDYFVLAGASLGYNESIKHKEPGAWAKSYEEHIDLALKMHHISEIIVIDHMNCEMYKRIYGKRVNTPERERDKHIENIRKLIETMKSKHKYSTLTYVGILVETHELADHGVSFNIIDTI